MLMFAHISASTSTSESITIPIYRSMDLLFLLISSRRRSSSSRTCRSRRRRSSRVGRGVGVLDYYGYEYD